MKSLDQFLQRWSGAIFLVLVLFTWFSGCNSCNTAHDIKNERKANDSLRTEVKKLENRIYTKDETDIRLEILGLETSKRTLYDWNAVVRTAVRPDDQMNQYDKQIQDLRARLK